MEPISASNVTQIHSSTTPPLVSQLKKIGKLVYHQSPNDDFSQIAYAEDNTPNTTQKTVLKRTLQEVEKASKIFLHKLSFQSMKCLLLCHLVWREVNLQALQTRIIFQILLFIWNNISVVWKLQTVRLKTTSSYSNY